MVYLLLGAIAFLFFFLYDFTCIFSSFRFLRFGFFAGCFLLTTATVGMLLRSFQLSALKLWPALVGGVFALFFLWLLIYSLFFALSFTDTYGLPKKEPALCDTGVYALCRHPGVLGLMGFYLCIWLMLRTGTAFLAFAVFSVLDIAYALFQDRWTFMKLFAGYQKYQNTTPFLLPNRASMRRCLKTWKRRRNLSDEI